MGGQGSPKTRRRRRHPSCKCLGEKVPGRKKSKCKGPGVGLGLSYSRDRRKPVWHNVVEKGTRPDLGR